MPHFITMYSEIQHGIPGIRYSYCTVLSVNGSYVCDKLCDKLCDIKITRIEQDVTEVP